MKASSLAWLAPWADPRSFETMCLATYGSLICPESRAITNPRLIGKEGTASCRNSGRGTCLECSDGLGLHRNGSVCGSKTAPSVQE